MNLAELLSRLPGARASEDSEQIDFNCVVCGEEGAGTARIIDGRIVLYCWLGCEKDELAAAVGIGLDELDASMSEVRAAHANVAATPLQPPEIPPQMPPGAAEEEIRIDTPASGKQPPPSSPNRAGRRRIEHDVAEIERTIRTLHPDPGDITELRVLGPGKLITAGFFDSGHIHEAAMLAAKFKAKGIYIVLNRVHPGLLALAANRFIEKAEKTTADEDVLWRLWLPLDFDPIKPSGISSSDQEKEAARQAAMACVKWLREQGWPPPVIADSGNGFHVLYALDLPNDGATKTLLKRVFASLAGRFTNTAAKFDVANFNAARIFKLYGTIAGKGDELPDRPHRLSRLLQVPDPIQPVSLAQLEAVAGPAVAGSNNNRDANGKSGNSTTRDQIEEALAFIDPDPRENWLHVGMALKSELDDEAGQHVWDRWSAGSEKFNQADQDKTWERFTAGGGIKIGTLFKLAADGGWCRGESRRNSDQGSRADGTKARRGGNDRSTRASEVRAARIHSVWSAHGKPDHIYLARGKLFSIEGDPGNGKSALVVDLLARLSSGTPFPDGWECKPANVIYVSAEDDAADTIRPRLEAAGADLDRVRLITTQHGLLGLPKDLGLLHDFIREDQAAIVALDPIDAFLDSKIDANKNQSIRTVLVRLSQLAHVTRTVIAFVRHLNKQADNGRAMYRGSGSIAFTAACRGVYLVGPDPGDPDRRVFACTKNNLGPRPPALGYRIVGATCPVADGGEIRTMRIEWLGPVQFTSDDLVRPITGAKAPGPDPEQLQTAQELILAMLTDGQRPANEVSQAAKLQGISYRTLSRAAARLGVKRSKPEFDGPWFWRLPSVPWGSQNGTGPDDEEHGS